MQKQWLEHSWVGERRWGKLWFTAPSHSLNQRWVCYQAEQHERLRSLSLMPTLCKWLGSHLSASWFCRFGLPCACIFAVCVGGSVCVSICHLTVRQPVAGNQSQCECWDLSKTGASAATHSCRTAAGERLQGPQSSLGHWDTATARIPCWLGIKWADLTAVLWLTAETCCMRLCVDLLQPFGIPYILSVVSF